MSRLLRLVPIFVAALVLLAPRVARAHKPSDSYVTLEVSGAAVAGRWDVAVRDLDLRLGLDRDADGGATSNELRSRFGDIDEYVLSKLLVSADGTLCPGVAQRDDVVEHSDGEYVVIHFALACTHEPHVLDIDYELFSDDPQHRGFLNLDAAGAASAFTFSSDHRRERIELRAVSRRTQLASMVRVGVLHIWHGYDHILFLLALLLPSVLTRDASSRWKPVARFRPALWDVLRIVTSFTVAHSLTLSLAALDIVRLPSRLTESGIAASVVVAALNNVVPILGEGRWRAAFALGLLHGFGFSATLIDLGLPRSALVLTLFGFNLGVEIGQLTIVAAFLPLAFAARRTTAYQRYVLGGGSLVIAALATVWFVERVVGVRLVS